MITKRDVLVATFGIVLIGSGLAILFGLVVLKSFKDGGARVKCGNNLGQIAKAAFQYATDWRYYPHISRPGVLDGDHATDTASRCMRALVWDSLKMDNSETFVCPDSQDRFVSMPDSAKADGQTWVWGQSADSTARVPSPIVAASGDPTLVQQTQLSYGWTMKQITSNSGAQTLIAGDRASIQERASATHTGNMSGNHKGHMFATSVDSHILKVTPSTPGINTTNIGTVPPPGGEGGSLGVLNDDP
ncbi:hypothetical protein HY251_10310 [bacterium]|nr:hypothetical protein [bacterium]